jgi:hypothetical protein
MGKDAGAKPLQAAIEMMSCIFDRLSRLFRNFSKTIALKEVEFQCALLVRSKLISKPVEELSGVYVID